MVRLQLSGGATADVHVYVVASKPLGFPFILGMNGILVLGGVTVNGQQEVSFGVESAPVCAATRSVTTKESLVPTIDEKDFSVSHDPVSNTKLG